MFWRSLLTQYAYSSISTLFILCHCIRCNDYELSAVLVRISEENTLNTKTQQFITAKISDSALRRGITAYSSKRQSNLQLQNQAALMSRRIRAVEHKRCVAGLAGAHPGLQDRILLNYTIIENAHKVHRKIFFVVYGRAANFKFSFFTTETLPNP